MAPPVNKTPQTTQNKAQSNASSVSTGQSETSSEFEDLRPEALAQRKVRQIADNSPQQQNLQTFQRIANQVIPPPVQKKESEESTEEMLSSSSEPIQQKENKTGLPDILKTGIEHLSGYSMDDVKVHYNSAKPAQLQAHAFAKGSDIHVAAGQEKHLPHEAWHVVQQKQGRVKPTMQLKGKFNINDDSGLEREADVMGGKAANTLRNQLHLNPFDNSLNTSGIPVIQGKLIYRFSVSKAEELAGFKKKKGEINELIAGYNVLATPNEKEERLRKIQSKLDELNLSDDDNEYSNVKSDVQFELEALTYGKDSKNPEEKQSTLNKAMDYSITITEVNSQLSDIKQAASKEPHNPEIIITSLIQIASGIVNISTGGLSSAITTPLTSAADIVKIVASKKQKEKILGGEEKMSKTQQGSIGLDLGVGSNSVKDSVSSSPTPKQDLDPGILNEALKQGANLLPDTLVGIIPILGGIKQIGTGIADIWKQYGEIIKLGYSKARGELMFITHFVDASIIPLHKLSKSNTLNWKEKEDIVKLLQYYLKTREELKEINISINKQEEKILEIIKVKTGLKDAKNNEGLTRNRS